MLVFEVLYSIRCLCDRSLAYAKVPESQGQISTVGLRCLCSIRGSDGWEVDFPQVAEPL